MDHIKLQQAVPFAWLYLFELFFEWKILLTT
jgi:hypothetical protein